jgi:hypothetical protein
MKSTPEGIIHIATGESVDRAFLQMAVGKIMQAHEVSVGERPALAFTLPHEVPKRSIFERLNPFAGAPLAEPAVSDELKASIESRVASAHNRLGDGRWLHIIDARYVQPLTPEALPEEIPTSWIQY